MDFILRRIALWKGRRKSAQIIVFDGGGDVQRSRAFLKGALTGIAITAALFALTAPNLPDAGLIEQLDRREGMLRDSNDRLSQAVAVADICLNTAQQLEETLGAYQAFLSGGQRAPASLLRAP